MKNKRTTARRGATFLAALGALVMSSGVVLMTSSTSANAAECVPQAAFTETSDWVATSPGAGWTQVDSRVKTDATEGHWTDLVWHNYTGKQPEGTPTLDDPNWHETQGDPKAENHSVPPRIPNVPYFVSNENSGNGDWFLWTGTWVEGSPDVYEYKFAFNHPAVTCDEVSTPTSTSVDAPKQHTTKTKAKTKSATVTPTVVHAGLADLSAEDMRGEQGLALMAAGMIMLVAAGGLGLRLRGAAARI